MLGLVSSIHEFFCFVMVGEGRLGPRMRGHQKSGATSFFFSFFVITGLVPVIHVFLLSARDKNAWHDEKKLTANPMPNSPSFSTMRGT